MYAMRAKDLHCGRGSSPLRTKFKTPKSNRSRSNSPLKRSTHKIEYYYENGVININTPIKGTTTFEREERSPKTNTINKLKDDNSSLKNFNRRSKVLSESSQEKGNSIIFYIIETLVQKTPEAVKHEQRVSKFTKPKSPIRSSKSITSKR